MKIFEQGKMIARQGHSEAVREKLPRESSTEKFNILIRLGAASAFDATAIHAPDGAETHPLL